MKKIHGAEAVLIQGDNLILGVQETARWTMKKGMRRAVIKTIGGRVRSQESSLECLRREIVEEITWSSDKDFDDIFCIEVPKIQYRERWSDSENQTVLEDELMAAVVTAELDKITHIHDSGIELHGVFYFVRVCEDVELLPNDLPALCIIPLDIFASIDLQIDYPYSVLQKYLKGKSEDVFTNGDGIFAFMIPNVVKKII